MYPNQNQTAGDANQTMYQPERGLCVDRKISQVESEINSLRAEVSCTEGLIDRLHQKLSSVLIPNIANGCGSATPSPERVPLADEIYSNMSSLNVSNSRLRELIERIEL